MTGLKTIILEGQVFRDLDHDGVLSPYEDHRLSPDVRTRDLLSRMTVAEKVGVMMHGTLRSLGPLPSTGRGSAYDLEENQRLIAADGINHFITRLDADPAAFAAQNNALQRMAAESRLGIPVTISTDPRHHFQHVTGASSRAKGFSQWPETTGMAAIGSSELVERFADIARREYRAVGIHVALSPQADIATEPRWGRISGTFGERPAPARKLVKAYVAGMQGSDSGLTRESVACVVKHWIGYPAAPEGFDGHNPYGQLSTLTEETLAMHVEAFLGAFEVEVAGVMPTYTIVKDLELDGELIEPVAGGFNRQLVTDLLSDKHGYQGFVLSDWAIYKDLTENTYEPEVMQSPSDIAMPWGVEGLTRAERFAKSIAAGVDQFGGEEDVATLISLVNQGTVPESRIDESVGRLLEIKFRLGLFDHPLVDEQAAEALVGASDAVAEGRAAQRRSVICLKRPVKIVNGRYHLVNFASGHGVDLALADAVIMNIDSPRQILHPHHFFGSRQHEGDLDYKEDAEPFVTIQRLAAKLPVIVVVQMTRPAVLTNLMDLVEGIYVNLGVADEIMLEVISSGAETSATIPFELPSSMSAVASQRSAVPEDSDRPLFAYGSDYRS